MHRPQDMLKYIKEAEENAKKRPDKIIRSVDKVKKKDSFCLDFFHVFQELASSDETNYAEKVKKLKDGK